MRKSIAGMARSYKQPGPCLMHAIVKLLRHRVAMGLMARNSRKVRPLD